MSGPHDQQHGEQPYQPYQHDQPQPSYQQGYPPPYMPGGYPQPGYQQQWPPPASEPARRPGVLVAAGVLWLLNGAFLLVLGGFTAVADQLPGFEEAMLSSGVQFTREELLAAGVVIAVFGAAMVGLGLAVLLTGATWARILIIVVALLPTVFLFQLVVFPLFTIAAIVLQFLPPVGRYVEARRRQG